MDYNENASNRRSNTSRSSQRAGERSTSAQRAATAMKGEQRPAGTRRAGQRSAGAQRSGQRPAGTQRSGQRPAGAQRTGQRPQARRRKQRVSPLLVTLIVALALVIVVFAGMGVYVMRYNNYDKILPNVYVAGIDVGGMTKEEAKAAIESSLTETTQQSLNVNLPDKTLTFTPQQDTVLIDVDQAVEEAYAYGRASSSPFTMARAIKAAQRRRNDIDITSAVQVDEAYIRQLIDSTAAEAETPLTESTVQADPDSRTITVTVGSPSRSIDADELYALVSGAFANANYSDIDFDYDVVYPATVQLDQYYESMTSEPKDARYNPDTESIEAEVVGYMPAVALEQANEQLAMASSGEVLTFAFTETLPEVTAEQLNNLLFRDVLAEKGTYYAANSNRTHNLDLACEAINGTVVQPGDVFSFNKATGERTEEKGYRSATVFVSGQSKPETAGGVCQVASTIYYCAMYADLEIVERSEHAYIVDYIDPGLDATVYWGSLDMQWRNSTDYPIKVNAYLSDGRCWIELIGTNVTGQYAEIDYERTATVPFTTVTTDDPDEVQTGYTGYTYVITRYIYDANDNLIRTDTTADLDRLGSSGLGTSVYSKRDKVVYGGGGGGGSDEDEEPSPSPSDDPDASPSASPTAEPTTAPTVEPTVEPTTEPAPPPAEPEDPVVVPDPPADDGGGGGGDGEETP